MAFDLRSLGRAQGVIKPSNFLENYVLTKFIGSKVHTRIVVSQSRWFMGIGTAGHKSKAIVGDQLDCMFKFPTMYRHE